jgi:hypothetical protein
MPDAIHEQCLQAVKAGIEALALSGLAGGVAIHTVPDLALVHLPCVIVTTDGERETLADGSNIRDDVTFPVRVWIAAREGERETLRPTYLRWREQITRAFHHQRLTTVSDVFTCTVRPLAISGERKPEYQAFVSGLVVDCAARPPRT